MRVLLINHFPLTGSGSGVYTKNIADSLIKEGHEVCIIFPENQKISENEKIKYHPIYFKEEENLPNQLDFNFPCFTTHPRSINTFYDLTENQLELYKNVFKDALEEEIEVFKPDIIHVGHIWILSEIASYYNIPVVITAHGTDLIGYEKTKRFRTYADNAAKKCKEIITISKENKLLVEKTFPFVKNKTSIISNGYNKDIFYKENYDKEKVLKELGILKNYKYVISFVGKFTYFKGIDLILKAAVEYQRDDVITILCGEGELFEEMRKKSEELNLKNIAFLGNQPHEVLRKVYNIADVSLVPSRNEAFGLVSIEAGACGTPVIASNDGGLPDIITKKTGILITPEDYHELALKIQDVLNQKIKFEREYIANYVKDNYSQDKFTKDLVAVYNRNIKKG